MALLPGAVCGALVPRPQEEQGSAVSYNMGYSSYSKPRTLSQMENWLKLPAELKLFLRQLQKVKLCVCG